MEILYLIYAWPLWSMCEYEGQPSLKKPCHETLLILSPFLLSFAGTFSTLDFLFFVDCDITWGDGIYSAYFTQLGTNPGFFSVSLQISDNNGQAVVPVHTNISRGHYGKHEKINNSTRIISVD